MLTVPRRTERNSMHDLPGWMHELRGFDEIEEDTDPRPQSDTWTFTLTLPTDLTGLSEVIDPLLILAVLVGGVEQIEDKITEVVRVARDEGRSWTQIGDALGMTKQAAWERFSGED